MVLLQAFSEGIFPLRLAGVNKSRMHNEERVNYTSNGLQVYSVNSLLIARVLLLYLRVSEQSMWLELISNTWEPHIKMTLYGIPYK